MAKNNRCKINEDIKTLPLLISAQPDTWIVIYWVKMQIFERCMKEERHGTNYLAISWETNLLNIFLPVNPYLVLMTIQLFLKGSRRDKRSLILDVILNKGHFWGIGRNRNTDIMWLLGKSTKVPDFKKN